LYTPIETIFMIYSRLDPDLIMLLFLAVPLYALFPPPSLICIVRKG